MTKVMVGNREEEGEAYKARVVVMAIVKGKPSIPQLRVEL